jgi:hypothetical protein
MKQRYTLSQLSALRPIMSGVARIYITASLVIAASLMRNVLGGDLYVDNIRG